jgi:hypothetical protein
MSIVITDIDIASKYFESISDESDSTIKKNPKLYTDFENRFDVECIEQRKTLSTKSETLLKLLVTEKTTKKTDWLNYFPTSEFFELYGGTFLSNQDSFLETDIFCKLAIRLYKSKK